MRQDGKPYMPSATNLGLNPCRCMVVEDVRTGVEAGCNANYGMMVGIDRNGDREELLAHGADLVVADMAELPLPTVQRWFEKGIQDDSWNLTYYGFDPSEEKLRSPSVPLWTAW